jgi:uncharacterized protein involved in response to NO
MTAGPPPGVAGTGKEARRLALFDDAFRPFFLAAPVYAVVAVVAWLWVLLGGSAGAGFLPASVWHAHELLFGFATAALSGFLLTAAPTWSGRPPLAGKRLIALVLLWLAGRVAAWSGGAAPLAAAVVVFAYLPALALAVLPHLRAAGRRNMVFLIVLAGLSAAQALVLAGGLDADFRLARRGLVLAVDVYAVLITLIGGRVVPAFTRSALARGGDESGVRDFSTIDKAAIALVAAVALADLALPAAMVGWLSMAAGLAVAARLRGWGGLRTLRTPLLWVLHLAYLWLAAGLIWKGVFQAAAIGAPGDALHGLTIGAVGTMTLAIMSRAALGHSGLRLVAPRLTVAAYVLISLAAAARLAATGLDGAGQSTAMLLSGAAWCTAYALFLIDFVPLLLRPRRSRAEAP